MCVCVCLCVCVCVCERSGSRKRPILKTNLFLTLQFNVTCLLFEKFTSTMKLLFICN